MIRFPQISALWSNSIKALAPSKAQIIDIPSVEIHDIETKPDKQARALKHLIRANHVNHSIIYHNLEFHNHLPHILGSAYLFGSGSDHLNTIYDEESKSLEPWKDSPGEVSKHDWRDYLGDRSYQRAYIDFFEDELVQLHYDWKELVHHYLFDGENPLINNLIGGLGHPLIHLGYAFELANRTIAIEALALTTTFYNFFHKYLDNPSYTTPPSNPTGSVIEILDRVRTDKRFDGYFEQPGAENMEPLFKDHEDVVLEHWNNWALTDPKAQFEESQRAAVLLLVGTQDAGAKTYDFFLVHLLTTSHAVRVLLPLIPEKFHVPLVRQWWLFTLAVYIAQLRPSLKDENISAYPLKGEDWAWAGKMALTSSHCIDAHYVKGIRAMKEAALMWGDPESWYLRAAVRFAREFERWGGFGE
ncbi:MAG: hypothetical protein M1833_000407 [Piccolia ochrophora]|nr:MAG: hypothetical protein M1833_000407 [Piccolia ochrophora]